MRVIRTIVLTCLGGLLPTAAVGQTIVWTDNNASRIQRKDVNDGEVKTIVQFPFPKTPSIIHYDPITAKLYYKLFGITPDSFQRANLDGSDPEDITTPSGGNFTLNVDSRKLYWISAVDSGTRSVLNRSELDGTGVESHTYPTCCINTLETVRNDLFFGASGVMLKGIWRADADGSNEQFLRATLAADLAYDPVENKLYVAAYEAIVRINTDGTGFQEILAYPTIDCANQVVVDAQSRKVYWGCANVIGRANLDGSNVEDFVTASDVVNPNFDLQGLTIVYSSTPIPTLSGLSLIVMGSILLGAGIFVLRKRRLTQSEGTTDG